MFGLRLDLLGVIESLFGAGGGGGGGGGSSPSLDFSDANNSQYLGLV